MKNSQFIIFLTVVLTIYSVVNIYIFFKGFNVAPQLRVNRSLYTIIFILLAAAFIAAKFIEARHSSVFTDVVNVIGGFWLGFMLYGTLLLLLSDIIWVPLKIGGILNSSNTGDYRKWAFLITVSVSAVLIVGGFINAVIPVIREYNLTIDKPAGEIKTLRVAAVSDIHVGSVIRKRSMKKLSAMLEELKPDLVLLLGDIVDGEIGPVLRGDLLKYFTGPHTKDGLYAITGNHEFIGGAKRTIPYIESKGIRILKDEMVVLPGGVQLIGRYDRACFSFLGRERMPLEELMKNADMSKPIILLDHQPNRLQESADAGVDLQLSGHTHNGQMWPLNHITARMFELSYGYLRKGSSQFIVSSGFGLWGPRVRSGSHSEIMLINIGFAGSQAAD
jgi:predicted MPP superfamily phosphohydrolase